MKYQIGSLLLGLTNAHDSDWISIVEEQDGLYYHREHVENEDNLEVNIDYLNAICNFKIPLENHILEYIAGYQLDKDIIKQDFPYEYHVLDHKAEYIKILNRLIDEPKLGFEKPPFRKLRLKKTVYHIAYLLFILENNSVEITNEQKEIIQKLHDRELPLNYMDELVSRIKKLK